MRLVYLLLPLSLGLPITIPVEGTEVYQLQHQVQLQRPQYQQEQQQTVLAQNHSEKDHPSSSLHGSFINLDLNLTHRKLNNTNTRNATDTTNKDKILQAYLHTLHTSHLTAHTLSKYSPELLALALFSLLPLTLAILAVAERIARSWTVEAYPERGRDRRRFLGRERRCLMLARREREKRAVLERGWWIAERKR